MMDLKITRAKDKRELERCFPVMNELRPHLTVYSYLELYAKAHEADGYEIVALENENQVLAVMGYRILYDYVRGKHLYIDDLVATEKFRSQGLGAKLLAHAEVIARDQVCNSLRLATGIENALGKKFYEREGWTLRSVTYVKNLNPEFPLP